MPTGCPALPLASTPQIFQDPEAFEKALTELQMWGALRAQLEPEQAAVLDRVSGGGRPVADEADLV